MDVKTEFVQRYHDWRQTLTDKELREIKRNLDLLDDFRRDYSSIKTIRNMTIHQYAIRKGHKDTFCYRVETQLRDFGEIRGKMCSYYLYGIALNEDGNAIFCRERASKNRFGDNANKIFHGVRNEVEKIYVASLMKDDKTVETSPLSGFFASKLSYLFNPDQWIPIYGKNDLSALCIAFGLNDGEAKRTTMRRDLFTFMQSLHIDGITPYLFMRFCYSKKGYRDVMRPQNTGLVVDVGDPVSFMRYKRIETMETLAEKKRTGTLGEKTVLSYLIERRSILGITGDIDTPCLRGDDSCHYDFKYPTANGDCYVEAKASKCNLSSPLFYMSTGEHAFMLQHAEHYMVVFVNDVYQSQTIQQLSPNEIEEHISPIGYSYRI